MAQLLALCLPLGILLSPESLVLLGNSAGIVQGFTPVLLIVAAIITLLGVATLFHPYVVEQHNHDIELLSSVIGSSTTLGLSLSARLPITLLAATGMLVTAGFAFNEIFLYWFPNFGFAFLLLFLILVVNIAGIQWAMRLQAVTALTALVPLVFIIIAGLVIEPTTITHNSASPPGLHACLGILLLFLGLDYVVESTNKGRQTVLFTGGVVALVFLFLAIVSRSIIGDEVLSQTTIPHLKMAKGILGQTGRLLIGVTVITGAVAAVNGFFLFTIVTFRRLSESRIFNPRVSWKTQRAVLSIFLAMTVGIFLMRGVAGEEHLTVYFRGALILWMFYFTVQCFCASRVLKRAHSPFAIIGILISIILFIAVGLLLGLDSNKERLIIFTLLVLFACFGFSFTWLVLSKKFPSLQQKY